MEPTLKAYFEKSVTTYWSHPSLSDFGDESFTYAEVATQIARFHTFYKNAGIVPGDKIALCGKNSARWGIAFLATITYGAVAVPLLHEFTPDNIHWLVDHSESRLFFVADNLWQQISHDKMPQLEAIIRIDNYELVSSKNDKITAAWDNLEQAFAEAYPEGYKPSDVHYYEHEDDELTLINYTSGTTAASKGVMIPARAIWSNMAFADEALAMMGPGMNIVSMLPMAHMYGMAFEFLYEFCVGFHIHFLRQLAPATILKAMHEVKPNLIVAVPLILEKIIRRGVLPVINKPHMKILRSIPGIKNIINNKIRTKLYNTLGGNFYEAIVGGAAFSHDVEKVLKEIKFPFTVGYGMTECAPIICYRDYKEFAAQSCGEAAPRMEVKVLSSDPQRVPGEIVARGTNVMLGYYKNPEATKQAIDDEGWLHTGDMGVIDADGNVFIKGRIKNMLLGPSGQNIYPEEIEDAISSLPYVIESVVVQRNTKLIALIYPDYDAARKDGLESKEQILEVIEKERKQLNSTLPAYSQLSGFELQDNEFEKTPKKSIKRFLYS